VRQPRPGAAATCQTVTPGERRSSSLSSSRLQSGRSISRSPGKRTSPRSPAGTSVGSPCAPSTPATSRVHSRTLEILDQRGIVDRFLAEGQKAQVAGFGATKLDISNFPTRHNYGLGLWQKHIERILAGWVGELPVKFYRGREVTGFTQDDTGVAIELSDGQHLKARYLVGCDGGRSVVRKAAGIEFPGWDATTSCLIAEVELSEEAEWGLRRDAKGTPYLMNLSSVADTTSRLRLFTTIVRIPPGVALPPGV